MPTHPIVWSIAGSDSGAGAGLQADLRALDTFDVHACTAVAAITAQNSVGVDRVDAVDTGLLDAQLATLAADLPPHAVKTGLLASAANVHCVARWIDRLREARPTALVVDPVWRASTGADLNRDTTALRDALLNDLLPRATAITPNRTEAAWLLGWDAAALADTAGVERAAKALRGYGPQAVVITGGDAGGDCSLDFIATPQASGWLALRRVDTPHHHGSGCVFASSLAAALALDFCAADAAVIAKMNTTHALQDAFAAGGGAGAVRPKRGAGQRRDLMPSMFPSTSSTPLVASAPRRFPPLTDSRIGLYAVVDSADWIDRVLAAGARTVQLRIKDPAHPHLADEIARSVRLARAHDAQLFINDHWRLAIEHGAYGVHLGQEDLASVDRDALLEAGLRLGVSTHSLWEACSARAWRPSYIACGPIHATRTKDMPWRPQGAANVAWWAHLLHEPLVAIGGMDEVRSHEAARCGAAGVAVVRAITEAEDIRRAVTMLQKAIAAAAWEMPLAPPPWPRSTLSGLVD